ncbi:hypothetical protein [Robiginitalea sp. SC105]|uniref:hypothetical protein n=1 Tax=Robiginitalea sp. SC105 TaxID=2762332 RepID=UPI00163AC3A4|nr:hypothetical protein [Robiginitalea sp. SC105]MBC2838894.1 hypothetical protein [Robiginitalea sp. SC105]
MARRLVVLSDLWGSKKGLWITSYLGYLQQYYDIVYYDSRQMAAMDLPPVHTLEELYHTFAESGMKRAAAQLLSREKEPCHYLAFGGGGSIAWQAALMGLPMKSLYAVSPLCLQKIGDHHPDCPVTLVYGEYHENRPAPHWFREVGLEPEVIERFGQELYSDEKIIQKVCMDLLDGVLKGRDGKPRKQLSAY